MEEWGLTASFPLRDCKRHQRSKGPNDFGLESSPVALTLVAGPCTVCYLHVACPNEDSRKVQDSLSKLYQEA